MGGDILQALLTQKLQLGHLAEFWVVFFSLIGSIVVVKGSVVVFGGIGRGETAWNKVGCNGKSL